jgi:hypothetical protein
MAEEKGRDQNADATDPPEGEDRVADKYPHGLRLVTVVAAVMLTVFLTSLDQVSSKPGILRHPPSFVYTDSR